MIQRSSLQRIIEMGAISVQYTTDKQIRLGIYVILFEDVPTALVRVGGRSLIAENNYMV
jgi:hypothetical protein